MESNRRVLTSFLHESAAFTERQVRYSRTGFGNRTELEDLSQKHENRNELNDIRLLNKDLMNQKRAWEKEKYEYQLNELTLRRKLKSAEGREEKLSKMVEKYKQHISVLEERHQRKFQELQSVKEKEYQEAISDLEHFLRILNKHMIKNGQLSETESRSLTVKLRLLEKLTERNTCLRNSSTQTNIHFTGGGMPSMQNMDVNEHNRNEREMTVSEVSDCFKKRITVLILLIIFIYICFFAKM